MKDFKTKDAHNYYIGNNVSLTAVGRVFGISGSALRKRFIKNGLLCKSRNKTRERKLDTIQLEDMYIRRKLSMVEISERLGVSKGTIHNRLIELGINKCPGLAKSDRSDSYTHWTQEMSDAAEAMLKETKDMRAVARKFGVTKPSIDFRNRKWRIDLSENSTLFGIPTTGIDGIKYRSKLEANVADFLLDNDIAYNYEVRVCKERQWTCDFLVMGIWIEVDGLGKARARTGTKAYPDNEKIKYYEDNNYNYRVIGGRKWKTQLQKILDL